MNKYAFVVGARPNFMKIAPILRCIDETKADIQYILVHTGQHKSVVMSDVFFNDLGIKHPDYIFDTDSDRFVRAGPIMSAFSDVIDKERITHTFVVGDVDSTFLCAFVAKNKGCFVMHAEAGLRSFDTGMPEELNRVLTDSISDKFFVTESSGVNNLVKEGRRLAEIHLVGNLMIDSLIYQLNKLNGADLSASTKIKSIIGDKYVVLTMHRPSNVDSKPQLERIISKLLCVAIDIPIVFCCHPRTANKIDEFGFSNLFARIPQPNSDKILITDPLGYNDFINILKDATAVITDSGGIQEELVYLNVPCITIRNSTERPSTIQSGGNILIGKNYDLIRQYVSLAIHKKWPEIKTPELWDGNSSSRILNILTGLA
jgi:UDP-N-acetylglucosamine 2-epimerase (non-hydrolysing)